MKFNKIKSYAKINISLGILGRFKSRLHKIITDPLTPLSYKIEKDTEFRDTSVSSAISGCFLMISISSMEHLAGLRIQRRTIPISQLIRPTSWVWAARFNIRASSEVKSIESKETLIKWLVQRQKNEFKIKSEYHEIYHQIYLLLQK